jgi:hypothetical protein
MVTGEDDTMRPDAAAFRESYAAGLRADLDDRGEQREHGLHVAYDLGRKAMERELTVLELAAAHHDNLVAAIRARHLPRRGVRGQCARGRPPPEPPGSRAAPSRRRTGFRERSLRRRLSATRRHRPRPRASVELRNDGHQTTTVTSGTESEVPAGGAGLGTPITAVDGRELGSIELFDKSDRQFTEMDEAVLAHVAQMAAAAIERAELYGSC